MEKEVKNYEELDLGKKYEVGTKLGMSAILEVCPSIIEGCGSCYFKEQDCSGVNCNEVIYKQIN